MLINIEMQRMELVHVWLTIFWNKNKWNQLLAFLSSQYYLEICLKKNYNVCVCRVSIENFHTILILEYDQSNPSLMYNAKLLTGRCHFWHCWGTRLQVMVMNFVNNWCKALKVRPFKLTLWNEWDLIVTIKGRIRTLILYKHQWHTRWTFARKQGKITIAMAT